MDLGIIVAAAGYKVFLDMEQEVEKSQFYPFLRKNLSFGNLTSNETIQSIFSLFQDRKNNLFLDGIFSRLFAWLVMLSGKEAVVAEEQNCVPEQFRTIVNMLVREEFAKGVHLKTERYNDAPQFYSVHIHSDYKSSLTDGIKNIRALGGSFGKSLSEVFARALGEFLERYFLTIYKKKDLMIGSMRSLKSKGYTPLDLTMLSGFSVAQKERNERMRWDTDSKFLWVKGVRLSTGKSILLPAQLVYWNYVLQNKEPFLREPNTNGNGGMFNRARAILAGIYELVERDAFLTFWLNGISPEQIEPQTIPDPAFQALLEESHRYGFDVFCLNTLLDTGVPSFIVVIGDPSGISPRFSVGGACHCNPLSALYKALEEAWGTYHGLRQRMKKQPVYALDDQYEPFSDGSIRREQRKLLWANPDMEERFSFFLSGKRVAFDQINFPHPSNFSSDEKELKYMVQAIERLGSGYEIYVHEVSHKFLKKIGYSVARVIIPQLISLYLNENAAPLGAVRIKKGLLKKEQGDIPTILNPLPHPFP